MNSQSQLSSSSFVVPNQPTPAEIVWGTVPSISNKPNLFLNFNVNASPVDALQSTQCMLTPPQVGANPAVAISVPCTATGANLSSLVDGDYLLKVTSKTVLGATSSSSKVFRIDMTAPLIAVSQTPAVITNQINASFVLNVSDNFSLSPKMVCTLDTVAMASCTSNISLSNLAAGSHTLVVRATDDAGNQSIDYSYPWKIDLSVPSVVLSEVPASTINVNTSNFNFTGANGVVSFECKLDAGTFAVCTAPMSFSALTSGSHTFTVHGKNVIGVLSSDVSFTWLVDTVAPSTPMFAANVQNYTNMKAANVSFSSTDAGAGIQAFTCTIDSVAISNCTSPQAFTALAEGTHTFNVTSVDKA